MSVANLFPYHTFMETLKIFKFHNLSSIHRLLQFLHKNNKLLLKLPLVKLGTTKQNFVFMATKIWNDLRDKIFVKCSPTNSGIIIPGNAINSDLACSIGAIKSKLKHNLLCAQKLGDQTMW
jgi:hypothetical protein